MCDISGGGDGKEGETCTKTSQAAAKNIISAKSAHITCDADMVPDDNEPQHSI